MQEEYERLLAYQRDVEFYQQHDKEVATRQARIDGGLKGVHTIVVTYHFNNGKANSGFAIEEYQMPFDKIKMNNDIAEWTALREAQLRAKKEEKLQASYVFANSYTKEKL